MRRSKIPRRLATSSFWIHFNRLAHLSPAQLLQVEIIHEKQIGKVLVQLQFGLPRTERHQQFCREIEGRLEEALKSFYSEWANHSNSQRGDIFTVSFSLFLRNQEKADDKQIMMLLLAIFDVCSEKEVSAPLVRRQYQVRAFYGKRFRWVYEGDWLTLCAVAERYVSLSAKESSTGLEPEEQETLRSLNAWLDLGNGYYRDLLEGMDLTRYQNVD